MIKCSYTVSIAHPHKQLLEIEGRIECTESIDTITLQLALWRPGRYTAQYYGENVLLFTAKDTSGHHLQVNRLAHQVLQVLVPQDKVVIVRYQYLAKQWDAGGSWLDERLLYANPINFLYFIASDTSVYSLKFLLPERFELFSSNNMYNTLEVSFCEFVDIADHPVMASSDIMYRELKVDDLLLRWVMYPSIMSDTTILEDALGRILKEIIKIFKECPFKSYTFFLQFAPFTFCHGVEHADNTVIVLGPQKDVAEDYFVKNLIGLSSHELFHAWNVCSMRPREFLPYDFTQLPVFTTGFVAEGITTYYGDLLCARAGVWTWDQYRVEISKNITKHEQNQAKQLVTILDSSAELSIDGYKSSHPLRKVSIYDKGAAIALILDLHCRLFTDGKQSLDSIMHHLWTHFGNLKSGYRYEDIKQAFIHLGGERMHSVFEHCIEGTSPLDHYMAYALDYVGCSLIVQASDSAMEHGYGIRLNAAGEVILLASNGPGDKMLRLKDKLVTVQGVPYDAFSEKDWHASQAIEIELKRNDEKIKRTLVKDGRSYLPKYEIVKQNKPTPMQKEAFLQWIGLEF